MSIRYVYTDDNGVMRDAHTDQPVDLSQSHEGLQEAIPGTVMTGTVPSPAPAVRPDGEALDPATALMRVGRYPDLAGVQAKYVLGYGYKEERRGEIRPAVIVYDWGAGQPLVKDRTVNLVVFVDGSNDLPSYWDPEREVQVFPSDPAVWQTSVWYDPDKSEGTWHL